MPAQESAADWPGMLRAATAGHGLHAVYQPIIDVARGVVVGYEALTRFAGYPVRSPEPWFAAAHVHGLNAELQAAALRAAFAHRATLPANCFLTVNIGPEVLDADVVRAVWREQGDLRGVIVELTEHVVIDDWRALEPDLNRLRAAGALLAVDDAGSGYAGLTRLLALRPAMIKLDRALIVDVDHDEAKRALVEMLGTFAGRIDAWLLAEGIERAGELTTLADLGVPLAQGYFLGRPADPWAAVEFEAARTLGTRVRTRPGAGTRDTLRRHLEHPPVVTDAAMAAAAFDDAAVDLVVLCDDQQRPIATLDDRSAPVPVVSPGMRINVDSPVDEAALRAITRTDWAQPVLCTDNAGRYVGVVRMPRLIHAVSTAGDRVTP
ncbi:EAL domain-containing protein [Actinoplanes sp. NPDC049681]|uniref:EAL domain-containing protein n=1 Tax=Actinoplanes sp. NPDC049681 TaxID=3363905 RepID=UPI003787739E